MDSREKNERLVNDGAVNVKSKTEKKVFSYIEKHNMLEDCDRVVVGVSGGADSVCLFLLLLEYAKKVPLLLAVVHVNHGIRREAGKDARFVEGLCREKGVPFFLIESDVRELASREGYSEEDAGRRVRYEAFYQTAERLGGARIAVAHNSNDNAETMLFHLFRGSGLQGLSGIAPVRGEIIRPILCLERREVEAYLRSVSAKWCHDVTNEEDDYRRNRIRHHILPYAESEVVSGVVGHMGRTAELLREAEEYLEQQTQEALGRCTEVLPKKRSQAARFPFGSIPKDEVSSAGAGNTTNTDIMAAEGMPEKIESSGFRIDAACFMEIPVILQKRILLKLLNKLSPTGKDISAVHVMDTLELFGREGNREICLPFGIKARRQYGYVFLGRGEVKLYLEKGCSDRNRVIGGTQSSAITWKGHPGTLSSAATWKEQPVPVTLGEEIFRNPLVYDLGDWGKIEFMGFFIKKCQEVPQNQYTKWFDYDKIKECVVIRPRCQGDYLTIVDGSGNMRRKSVKNYMVTEKIPRQIRNEIPLVAAGSHVLWLTGWRISEAYKVDGNTERILQVKLLGTEFCEDNETEEKNGGEH